MPLNSQVSVWSPKSCLKVIRIWLCPAFGCLLTKVYDQLHKSYWLGLPMFPLLYDMVLTFWHLNPWAKLKSVTIQMNPLSSTFRDGGQENQNTTRKEKKQMNNLKSYRLSGACNVSRRVYNLRSKRQFRALFKNQPNKLTGPTQG